MFLVLAHTANWQHEFGCLLCLSRDVTRVTLHFLPRPGSRVDQVDLGLPSRVKSVCSSVTVEIFWRRRFHYKSFQVGLRSRLNQ